MTRQLENVVKCSKCGSPVPTATPFSEWLRALPYPLNSAAISNHNLDYIWHAYKSGWFITIEEKRFGAKSAFSQRDTHGVVTQLLTKASGAVVKTARNILSVLNYRGHYEISFEKTSPNDSAWVDINTKRYIGVQVKPAVLYLLTHGAMLPVVGAAHTDLLKGKAA